MKQSTWHIALLAMFVFVVSCTNAQVLTLARQSNSNEKKGQTQKPATHQALGYKGLQLGMSGHATLKVLTAMEENDYQNLSGLYKGCTSVEKWIPYEAHADSCERDVPQCDSGGCDWRGLTVRLNAGRTWGIQQNIPDGVQPYVLAFTRKYGPPKVERRTYRNGLGSEFHGNAWVWGSHDGDSLQVMEICAGASNTLENDMPDIGCLVLHSFAYAPKQPPPKI